MSGANGAKHPMDRTRARLSMGRAGKFVAAAVLVSAASISGVKAFPIHGSQTVLPDGSDLNEDALRKPREIFKSEAGGKSYLVNLGDLAFSSPALLGDVARRAGISCSTCHVNGAGNSAFFVPGLSTRHGNLDTTGAIFNPPADDHVLNPLTIPSLRGARFLGPYGHDGRQPSLRGFVRNVIVEEFGGAEPSAAILDALVAYIEDIEFLPNPWVASDGRLTGKSGASARRGAALFAKAFPHDPAMSCAACHIPSGLFVDHQKHDVGSGGAFKTPTLMNANSNAPYFHDGRFGSYDEVVSYFDRRFSLGLSTANRGDLDAYLAAIGAGERDEEQDSIDAWLKEINDFASVLTTAIPAHDSPIINLAVETVGTELRELAEHFPDHKDPTVAGGKEERRRARQSLKEAVLSLRRIELAGRQDDFDAALTEYSNYQRLIQNAVPEMRRAEQWSLFDARVHEARVAAMRGMAETATAAAR